MNLHLLTYNNYYNRILRVQDILEEYLDFEIHRETDINFNPNDGIYTEHIIGGPSQYSGKADYCVISEAGKVVSRWFVIENRRTRGGQYNVILKRDSVADFKDLALWAPCFIEKGWVPDTDSAIFNSEQMTFNQIKKKEVLLHDQSNMPWLVGYYLKDNTLETSVTSLENTADITVNGIANWEHYSKTQSPSKTIKDLDLRLYFDNTVNNTRRIDVDCSVYKTGYLRIDKAELSGNQLSTGLHYKLKSAATSAGPDQEVVRQLGIELSKSTNSIIEGAGSLSTGYITQADYEIIEALGESEPTVYDSSTGTLYKVGYLAFSGRENDSSTLTNIDLTSNLGYTLFNVYSTVSGITGNRPTSNSSVRNFEFRVAHYDEIQLTLTEVSTKSASITINPIASGQTQNSPYNIFAIPYADNLRMVSSDLGLNKFTSKSLALRVVNSLITKYSGASPVLLDVQLLPYCPIPLVAESMQGLQTKVLNLALLPEYLYGFIRGTEEAIEGLYFNCPSTSVKTGRRFVIDVPDIKISNETEFCRLVSPNWNGIFEFSPAKNRGVEYFNIDLELKPYNPYIHVAPQFNEDGLYGSRDSDPIGLICGGDFGLTMLGDAWAQYERQNKNYQQIFDRQVQNLEVQHGVGRIQDIVGASVGTLSGAVSGASTGAFLGGGLGAAIGGSAGALLSGAGGYADYKFNEKLRTEAIDYTRDQFGYQLGNIKALPDSLTKVNSFNPNNTIFPILEFYGCTEEELEALRNKIRYNGMSIGRIGTFNEFKNPAEETYIKGQLIRLDDTLEDSHLVQDIANELYKGVRI